MVHPDENGGLRRAMSQVVSIRQRLTTAYYRVGQFVRGAAASVSPHEVAQAARRMPPGGVSLLMQMPVDAQRHSLNVLATLDAEGNVADDLAVAALLHDVGKVAAEGQISLWTRGPIVLIEAIAPRLMARLAAPTRGWRYALWVQQNHPAIGESWARQARCSELTCRLIARHQEQLPTTSTRDDEETRLLRRLQAADNQN